MSQDIASTILILVTTLLGLAFCLGGGHEKIRLENVQVLTLYNGRMTNARRGRPIPQLKCIGGRAGCSSFEPSNVQCYNRGSDGFDVQWECKTEMDKRYKFGSIEVSCEGYDYPDDPYILKGSCGLEYTIDYRDGGGGGWFSGGNSYPHGYQKKSGGFGDTLGLIIVIMIVYALYRSCFSNQHRYSQYSSTEDDHPDNGGQGSGGGGRPPPAGFRQDYMPGDAGGCGRNRQNNQYGGFWTGAMAGGLLGYLMGGNNRGGLYDRPYGRGGGGFFGGGGGGYGGGGFGGGMGSTSGFGGTRRR